MYTAPGEDTSQKAGKGVGRETLGKAGDAGVARSCHPELPREGPRLESRAESFARTLRMTVRYLRRDCGAGRGPRNSYVPEPTRFADVAPGSHTSASVFG